MIKLILFDLDNTLYPTSEQVNNCRLMALKAMKNRGLPGNLQNNYSKLQSIINDLGSNNEQHFNHLVKELTGLEDLSIISAGVTAYNTTKQGMMRTYPGTLKTLSELREQYELGILTRGCPMKQWDKINRLRIFNYFKDHVYITEEDKTIILEELLNNYQPSELLLVGDRKDSDILAANKTGVKSVQVLTGPYKNAIIDEATPDYVINSLPELLSIDVLKPETLINY